MESISYKTKFAILGAILVPCFGRLALHGTGSEYDFYRYFVPLFVGSLAGYLIGLMRDSWIVTNKDLRAVNEVLKKEINERKRAEQDLLREKTLLKTIIDNIPVMLTHYDPDANMLYLNKEFEKTVGWKTEEVQDIDLMEKVYPDPGYREQALEYMQKVSQEWCEFRIQSKSGEIIDSEWSNIRMEDGTQIGVGIDITERKKMEEEREKLQEQLLQTRKIEAIGSLAGGIAHEFNNILTTIIGNTQLAINDIPERNPARECLEEIQSASLRAKDVVRQLLGFARKSAFQLQPVHLSPVIKEAMILIRASTPAAIEIRQNLSCGSDMVMADSSQINMVVINLCTNAKDAMQEEGGVLEVKLENTTLDEKSAARYEDLGPGNYLKLSVKDSGHGIDPKIIDRIFDPYFTTASLAEGTGMGLAVVHGIVKHHNGGITVASEPGKGTVFEVLFPLTEAEAEQEAGEPEALPTGNEKILFVDDEASLVKMAKRGLEMQGYRVETKGNPVEALELFRSEPDRFDLIITDMTMPQMTGDKLAKEILNIRPDMPIILCSGFSEKIDAEKAKELGIRKYIEKPLNMSDFVTSIRKVLDEAKKKS